MDRRCVNGDGPSASRKWPRAQRVGRRAGRRGWFDRLTMNGRRRRWLGRLTMNGERRRRRRSGESTRANQAVGIGDRVARLTQLVYTT